MKMTEKIFVIYEDSVWDDQPTSNVVSVSNKEEVAKLLLRDYIKEVKEEIDFFQLNATEDSDDIDYEETLYEWVFTETDTSFSLYLMGEYDSNHIDINIEARPLIKEYIAENNLNSDIENSHEDLEFKKEYKQAISLPEGWIWNIYDDGSGHLESPHNEIYMEYDFQTKEYKETPDSWWSSMIESPPDYYTFSLEHFFKEAEEMIANRYLSKINDDEVDL